MDINPHTLQDKELGDKHIELYNAISEVRGKFISNLALLEMFINVFLARHFCIPGERENQMLEIILATNKMTYDGKREALACLINTHKYESYQNAFNGVKGINGTGRIDGINHHMITLGRERNIIAHCIANSTAHGIELFDQKIISFIRFKNDSQAYNFSIEKLAGLKEITNKCNQFMMALNEGRSYPPPEGG